MIHRLLILVILLTAVPALAADDGEKNEIASPGSGMDHVEPPSIKRKFLEDQLNILNSDISKQLEGERSVQFHRANPKAQSGDFEIEDIKKFLPEKTLLKDCAILDSALADNVRVQSYKLKNASPIITFEIRKGESVIASGSIDGGNESSYYRKPAEKTPLGFSELRNEFSLNFGSADGQRASVFFKGRKLDAKQIEISAPVSCTSK